MNNQVEKPQFIGQMNYSESLFMCSGGIKSRVKDKTNEYEVDIYASPMHDFQGAIFCSGIYSAGSETRYRKGEKVKVLVSFIQGGSDEKVEDLAPGTEAYIMGRFEDEVIIKNGESTENALLPDDDSGVRFFNEKSRAGMHVGDHGKVTIAANKPVYSIMSPGGFGVQKNAHKQYAQNFHQVISGIGDLETAAIHFGLNSGEDGDDEATKVAHQSLTEAVYRRFIPQNMGLDNWVSSCEGAFSPYMGMNNKRGSVNSSNNVLFYKVINAGEKRVTIRSGEPGEEFFSLRVDDVIKGESSSETDTGAATGSLGGLFSFDISDDGGFSIRGGKGGKTGVADSKIVIEGTAEGELKIKASKGITFTTGGADEEINSLFVGDGAVSINSAGSMVINGKEIMNKAFLEWFAKNAATMFITPPLGTTVMNPALLAELIPKSELPDSAEGFSTVGIPIPPSGTNISEDIIVTV